MSGYDSFSIKLRNYKCFGEKEQGFDSIKPINLIIGKNNSGKSTLVELIKFAVNNPDGIQLTEDGKKKPAFIFAKNLTENELQRVFRKDTHNGPIPGNHWIYGQKWTNTQIKWSREYQNQNNIIEQNSPNPVLSLDSKNKSFFEALVSGLKTPFHGKQVEFLSADRDIIPEKASSGNLDIKPNGAGATNIIQNYINNASLPSPLVEEKLLDDLNSICKPDSSFTRLTVQEINNVNWEVNFEEEEKGRVSMKNTGSGFKTVLLVLIYLNILPKIKMEEIDSFVFCFEELENNLHPALFRRLLLHIKKIATETNAIFFLTTHSSVAIDLFSNDKIAQILHVTHDGKKAEVKTVKTHIERSGVLDDLDIRASDLLLANCVVWVEGPTDRLYFNKWMELFTDGAIREGAHYQCVFYGGRLISHLSADIEEEIANGSAIQILKVNRHVIMMLDSDKSRSKDELNSTKKRIISEIEKIDGLAWVTYGREIENYIPDLALKSLYDVKTLPRSNRYGKIANRLNEIEDKSGNKYGRDKVSFAGKILPLLNLESLKETLDLDKKMTEVISLIKKWNGLEP